MYITKQNLNYKWWIWVENFSTQDTNVLIDLTMIINEEKLLIVQFKYCQKHHLMILWYIIFPYIDVHIGIVIILFIFINPCSKLLILFFVFLNLVLPFLKYFQNRIIYCTPKCSYCKTKLNPSIRIIHIIVGVHIL